MLMSPIIGHRGARGLAAENTLASIRLAAASGVQWIELDVTLTYDQVPILFHDADLNKLSNARGLLAKKRWQDLQRVRVYSPRGSRQPSQPMTHLAEAVALMAELGLGLNMEIKPSLKGQGPETLMKAMECLKTLPGLPLVISSFDQRTLQAAQQLWPTIPRLMLWQRLPSDWADSATRLAVHGVGLDQRHLRPAQVAVLRAQGREVYVYTVNSIKKARQLMAWGVQGVFTDHPNQLIQAGLLGSSVRLPFA